MPSIGVADDRMALSSAAMRSCPSVRRSISEREQATGKHRRIRVSLRLRVHKFSLVVLISAHSSYHLLPAHSTPPWKRKDPLFADQSALCLGRLSSALVGPCRLGAKAAAEANEG